MTGTLGYTDYAVIKPPNEGDWWDLDTFGWSAPLSGGGYARVTIFTVLPFTFSDNLELKKTIVHEVGAHQTLGMTQSSADEASAEMFAALCSGGA